MRGRRGLAALAVLALAAGCASGGGTRAAKPKAPRAVLAPAPVDSATIFVWHFDETGGWRVTDESPARYEGHAGQDTRVELGRVHGARGFIRSVDSFVYGDYTPAIESAHALTVEAWVRLDAIGQYEDTPIAMRWNPRVAAESWLFSVGGLNVQPPAASLPSPGDHRDLLPTGYLNRATARLMFTYMPKDAGAPRSFFSNVALELHRWIHVAVTFDGKLVCFYVDGRLDAQAATAGEIRASEAPLLVGNAFDTRLLTTSGGDLRLTPESDHNPYYAFQGTIDELRVSSVARTEFPYVR